MTLARVDDRGHAEAVTGRTSLDALTGPERTALRRLLVRTTAVADRPRGDGLDRLVSAAPVHALPAAAALHRVNGSVRRALEGVDRVPAEVRSELGAGERHASLHHLIVVGALSDIARAFDEAGLTWVVMKGPVLATHLYPSTGDRSYGDLDLLVDRRDFGAAVQILEDLGYRHTIHNWKRAEEMLAGEISLVSSTMAVDLHWHLHYSRQDRRPFALDPEAMLERARRVNVSGVDVPTLDQVDTVLTLAFHAARSDGHRLIWLKDVERAVAVDTPDFDELVRRCRAYRCAPPVGLILARARSVLEAQVPQDVVDATTPRALQAIDRIACATVHPIQLDERDTLTRAFTRSVRSSLIDSVADVPARASRWAGVRVRPPHPNETDDPTEKERYFRAVATSVG
jgi:hypothetical protein